MKIAVSPQHSIDIPDELVPDMEVIRLFNKRFLPTVGQLTRPTVTVTPGSHRTPATAQPTAKRMGRPPGSKTKRSTGARMDYEREAPRVLAFVTEHPQCSQPEIRAGLDDLSSTQISTLIQFLRTGGKIRNVGGLRHAARYEAVSA